MALSDDTAAVLVEVGLERIRQDELFPDQHLPAGMGPQIPSQGSHGLWWSELLRDARDQLERHLIAGKLTWLDIAREEVYELFAEGEPAKQRAEAIQATAVLVRFIEDLDRAAGQPLDPLPAELRAEVSRVEDEVGRRHGLPVPLDDTPLLAAERNRARLRATSAALRRAALAGDRARSIDTSGVRIPTRAARELADLLDAVDDWQVRVPQQILDPAARIGEAIIGDAL